MTRVFFFVSIMCILRTWTQSKYIQEKRRTEMGYSASVIGTIVVKGKLTPQQEQEISGLFDDCIDTPEIYGEGGNTNLDFCGSGKYYGDELQKALRKLTEKYEVEPGSELDFTGEEDDQWCFRYVMNPAGEPSEMKGEWKELQGEVHYAEYGMPSYEALLNMFVGYVTNDMEAGDPDYIRETLANCGCGEEMQKMLGLDPAA